jgi:hypothetical protein
MKTDNNSTIITFFNIYITCIEKRKNVKIILISNVYIIEGMCKKKVSTSFCMSCRKSAQFFMVVQFFWRVL